MDFNLSTGQVYIILYLITGKNSRFPAEPRYHPVRLEMLCAFASFWYVKHYAHRRKHLSHTLSVLVRAEVGRYYDFSNVLHLHYRSPLCLPRALSSRSFVTPDNVLTHIFFHLLYTVLACSARIRLSDHNACAFVRLCSPFCRARSVDTSRSFFCRFSIYLSSAIYFCGLSDWVAFPNAKTELLSPTLDHICIYRMLFYWDHQPYYV